MASNPSSNELYHLARQWAQQAFQAGWLDLQLHERLQQLEFASPEDLFANGSRPLVVGFFGGTGVGKSTLLNRLAGEPIARTGVERPTSREVTVYAHESVKIERLPEDMPLDKVKIAHHRNANRRGILWVDMPDIDSVEHANRELVLAWLPHIDVLIYVVSPERYRDDRGWHLLLEHSRDHAWLFVMNQWDQGHEAQLQDFTAQLQQAGFQNPILLRADSREELSERKPDDFGKLEEILTALANSHAASQLQARGENTYRLALQSLLQQALKQIGEDQAFATLKQRWYKLWRHTLKDLQPGLQWPMQTLAKEIAVKGQKRLKTTKATPEQASDNTLNQALLMDLWVQKRLEDSLDQLAMTAESVGLPFGPFDRALQDYKPRLAQTLLDQVQKSLRRALANPGNRLQRGALKLTAMLRIFLPLAASGWAGYQVVMRYYQGFIGKGEYLGLDFAIHSILLIFLAWLVPHLLLRALQPSLEKTALRGIEAGLDSGFEAIGQQVEGVLEELRQDHEQIRANGQALIQKLESQTPAKEQLVVLEDSYLQRMLATNPSKPAFSSR